jgi:hypothetical protein
VCEKCCIDFQVASALAVCTIFLKIFFTVLND